MDYTEITLRNGQTIRISSAPFTRKNAEKLGAVMAIGQGAKPEALADMFDLMIECLLENHSQAEVDALLESKAIRVSMAEDSDFRKILAALLGK